MTPPPLRLLIDINVILDVVLPREEWLTDAAAILNRISEKRVIGLVATHAITTTYYIVARKSGRAAALTAVADLLQMCDAVPMTSADFQRALALGLKDFEDAVTATAALVAGADYLVTRNGRDFKHAPVVARSPAGLLPLLV